MRTEQILRCAQFTFHVTVRSTLQVIYDNPELASEFELNAETIPKQVYYHAMNIGWWCVECQMKSIETFSVHGNSCVAKKLKKNLTLTPRDKGYIERGNSYNCLGCHYSTPNNSTDAIEQHMRAKPPAAHSLLGCYAYYNQFSTQGNHFNPHQPKKHIDTVKNICIKYV